MTIRTFLRNDGQFTQVDAGSISISTTTTTAFLTFLANSLAGDVNITSVTSYWDGPTVSLGSSGTWFAAGTVTLRTSGASVQTFSAKLWDVVTVVDSCTVTNVANGSATASLSGIITSPSSNLKISVKISAAVNSAILFNDSANSKDSSITAIRIG